MRNFKRKLELFEKEVEDDWEQDDSEYLSQHELGEAEEREKDFSENNFQNQDDKCWIDVDVLHKNGMQKYVTHCCHLTRVMRRFRLFSIVFNCT